MIKDLGEVLELRAKTLESGLSPCKAGDNPITRSGVSGDLLPASDSKVAPQPYITKTDGVVHYLRESINRLESTKAKDDFVAEWRTFVLAQTNHFFKIELVEKTKKALGIDIASSKAPTTKAPDDATTQLMAYIVSSEDCAYIASEYLDGSELGEWCADYRAFCRGELTERAQRLQLLGSTTANTNFVTSTANPKESITTSDLQNLNNLKLAHEEAQEILASCDDFACFANERAGSLLNANDQARMQQSSKSAQEANLSHQDIKAFRKLLGFVLDRHYSQLIATATLQKDYTYARALSHKRQSLKKLFS